VDDWQSTNPHKLEKKTMLAIDERAVHKPRKLEKKTLCSQLMQGQNNQLIIILIGL
jgi:hypothetical protein